MDQDDGQRRPRWTMERGTLWVMDFGAVAPSLQSRIPCVFGEIRPESVEALALAMGLPGPEPVCERFSGGRRCFGAWHDDRIVSYGWLSQGRECVGELEREMQMAPGEAYIWDCATLPAYRSLGLYSALLCHMTNRAREVGARRIWIGSSLSNTPSLRAFANAGFRPAIRLVYLRLFGLCFTWIKGDGAASDDVIGAARRAFSTDHEYRWRALAVGLYRTACA